MMNITLSGDRYFDDVVELKLDGERVRFWYWEDGYSELLEMVTTMDCIEKLNYKFILDE
jgi:hypothetical protein